MAIYGFCDAKCKYELYTKEEIDENFISKEEVDEIMATPITSGTTTPSNTEGNDGDVYLMYEA